MEAYACSFALLSGQVKHPGTGLHYSAPPWNAARRLVWRWRCSGPLTGILAMSLGYRPVYLTGAICALLGILVTLNMARRQ